MGRSKVATALAAITVVATVVHAQDAPSAFALHSGDRVVFYGDSITAQRFYTRDVELFVLTRYPAMEVEFHNAGVPGDRAWGGYLGDMPARVTRDVAPYKPTVVTVMLGMNDAEYGAFEQKNLDIFVKAYGELLTRLQSVAAPGARFTLIGSSPYDEMTHGTQFPGDQQTVARFGQAVRAMAQAQHMDFVDFNAPLVATLQRALHANASYAALLIPDRIHPADPMHWVMAKELMQGWHVATEVSSVRLDAHSGNVVEAKNATLTEVRRTSGGMAWTELEGALPLPISFDNPLQQFVFEVGNLEDVDREWLQVSGLLSAAYDLKIDGNFVATFSGKQLAAGVNLATLRTPMLGQAQSVAWIEDRRTTRDRVRFDLASGQPVVRDSAEAVRILNEASALDLAEERKKAQPVAHHFELVQK